MRRIPRAVGALAIAAVLAAGSGMAAGPAAAADQARSEPLLVAAMTPIFGLSADSLVTPAQQCRYANYCNSYGNCYRRRQCYVCWSDYGRQRCGWKWQ